MMELQVVDPEAVAAQEAIKLRKDRRAVNLFLGTDFGEDAEQMPVLEVGLAAYKDIHFGAFDVELDEIDRRHTGLSEDITQGCQFYLPLIYDLAIVPVQ